MTPAAPHPARTGSVQPAHATVLVFVLLGGAVGTMCRDAVSRAFPAAGTFPWVTFAINVSGAFLIGALLEGLLLSGSDRGWRRGARLGLGTGVLGGYTTYSTFALETAGQLLRGAVGTALAYAVGTVVAGFLAAYGATVVTRRASRFIGRRRKPS